MRSSFRSRWRFFRRRSISFLRRNASATDYSLNSAMKSLPSLTATSRRAAARPIHSAETTDADRSPGIVQVFKQLHVLDRTFRWDQLRPPRLFFRPALLDHRLGPLTRNLIGGVARHPLDQQFGECPHQRVDTVRRIACRSSVKIAGKTTLLVFEHRE